MNDGYRQDSEEEGVGADVGMNPKSVNADTIQIVLDLVQRSASIKMKNPKIKFNYFKIRFKLILRVPRKKSLFCKTKMHSLTHNLLNKEKVVRNL